MFFPPMQKSLKIAVKLLDWLSFVVKNETCIEAEIKFSIMKKSTECFVCRTFADKNKNSIFKKNIS
jgi:hypothetical protein